MDVAFDPAPWHDFYVMAGSAASPLTGLVTAGFDATRSFGPERGRVSRPPTAAVRSGPLDGSEDRTVPSGTRTRRCASGVRPTRPPIGRSEANSTDLLVQADDSARPLDQPHIVGGH